MKQQGYHLWSNKLLLSFATVLVGCFIALAGSLSSFHSSFDSTHPTNYHHFTHPLLGLAWTTNHHSGHGPFMPGTAPVQEAPGVKEASEDSDNEESRLFGSPSPKLTEIFHSRESEITALWLSIRPRSRVSRIILYHCWKSFLA